MTDANNCPSCGAPKRGAVCQYCGTHFGRYQGQATVEVEPDITTIYSWDGSAYQIANGYNVNVKVITDSEIMAVNDKREKLVEAIRSELEKRRGFRW